jgi:hypothetical protein
MKEIKFESKAYSPKSFGIEELQESLKGINDNPDTKRTICNVLRMAYNCMQDEAINANAARSLILEAFWMGKRMNSKLTKNKLKQLDEEIHEDDDDEYCFSVDFSQLPARGNWD